MSPPAPEADGAGSEPAPPEALARRVRDVDAATLAPVVGAALDDASATPTEWEREALRAGAGGGYGGTALWRFRGAASVADGGTARWALVLKTVAERPWERPDDPAYWRREAAVYRSTVVSDAPGLSMPRCYGVREFEGEGCWLWLQDLSEGSIRGPSDTLASRPRRSAAPEPTRGNDADDSGWSLGDFEVVARDLGRFNAYFARNPVDPRPDWLAVREFDFQQTAPTVALVDALPDDELVRAAFPGDQPGALFDVWDVRGALLDARAELPSTLCHFDAYPRNLFLRAGGDGPRTVAVDWDQLAEGAVGENAAALVVLSLIWADFDPERGGELAAAVFDAYAEGLRAGGWDADRRSVRRGFDVHLVLRWLEFVGRHVRCLADPSIHDWLAELMGRSVAEMRAALPAINRLAFERFDAVEGAIR